MALGNGEDITAFRQIFYHMLKVGLDFKIGVVWQLFSPEISWFAASYMTIQINESPNQSLRYMTSPKDDDRPPFKELWFEE